MSDQRSRHTPCAVRQKLPASENAVSYDLHRKSGRHTACACYVQARTAPSSSRTRCSIVPLTIMAASGRSTLTFAVVSSRAKAAADLEAHRLETKGQGVVLPLLVETGDIVADLGDLLLDAARGFFTAQGVRDLHRQSGHGTKSFQERPAAKGRKSKGSLSIIPRGNGRALPILPRERVISNNFRPGSNQGNSPAAEFCRERAPSRSFGPGTPRRAFPTEPAGLLP